MAKQWCYIGVLTTSLSVCTCYRLLQVLYRDSHLKTQAADSSEKLVFIGLLVVHIRRLQTLWSPPCDSQILRSIPGGFLRHVDSEGSLSPL